MTILVPTDFSDNASNAVEYAAEMAQVTHSRIILLHVLPPYVDERVRTMALEKLDITANMLKTEYSLSTCSTKIEEGDVVESILSVAAAESVGLVIMETEGAINFTRLFLGSKTGAVIEKTHCPVLSLPPDYSFKKPGRMIFCTNFSKDDIKGAVESVMIARHFDAEIIIAHVMVEPWEEEAHSSLVEAFSHELSTLTDYARIKYILHDDNTVTMGLDQLMTDTRADMIILSTRRRGILEKFYNPSITKKLSLHSNIPLLAFHISDES